MIDRIRQKIVEYLPEKLKRWIGEILENKETDSHPTLMKIDDLKTSDGSTVNIVNINVSINVNVPYEDGRKDGRDDEET